MLSLWEAGKIKFSHGRCTAFFIATWFLTSWCSNDIRFPTWLTFGQQCLSNRWPFLQQRHSLSSMRTIWHVSFSFFFTNAASCIQFLSMRFLDHLGSIDITKGTRKTQTIFLGRLNQACHISVNLSRSLLFHTVSTIAYLFFDMKFWAVLFTSSKETMFLPTLKFQCL